MVNNGCFEWSMRSIDAWGRYMFSDYEKPKIWEYFNTGFIIANKKHKPFFEELQNFYLENKEVLYEIRNNRKFMGHKIPGVGQTCVNFLVKKHNVKVNYLPERYNFIDLFRKNLLHIPGHSWWPDDLSNLYRSGWIYHFNAIPQNQPKRDSHYWMERVYKELYK